MKYLLLETDHVLREEDNSPLELEAQTTTPSELGVLVKVLKGHYPERRDANQRRNGIGRAMQLRRHQSWIS